MKMLREQLLQTLTCISVLIYSTFSLHITTNNRDSYRRPILDNIHRNLNTNTNRYISSSSSVSDDSRSSSSSSSNIGSGSRTNNNNIDIIDDSGIIFGDGNDNIDLVPPLSIQQQQQQQQYHHHPQQQMYQYHHQQFQHRPPIAVVPFVPFEGQQQQHHRRIEYDRGGDGGGVGDGGGGGDDAGLTFGGHFNLIPDYRRHHSSILNSINSNVNSDDGDLIGIDDINSVPSMHSSHHHNIPTHQLSSSSSSFPSPPYMSSIPTVFSSQLSPFSRSMTIVNAPQPPQQTPPHQLMMTNHHHANHRPLLASYLLHNNHNNNDNENINNGRPRNHHHHINIDTDSSNSKSSSSSSSSGDIGVGIGVGGISTINKNQNLNPTNNNYDDNARINIDNGMDSIEDDRIDSVGSGNDDSNIGIIRNYRNKGVNINNNAETPKSLEELFGNKNDKNDNLHHHHVKNNENENIIRQSTLDIRLEQQQQQQQKQQEQQKNNQKDEQQPSHSNKRSGSGMIPPPVTHSQLLLRSARGQRQYDVPQIECPPAMDGMERFACPTPDRQGRYRCIDDHVLCDGFIDCPEGEDEDRQACMFYKTTKAHLDVLADALLRWARGR